MPDSKKSLYERILKKNLNINATAKVLAYFVFREIIEDAHVKYNISQDEMMAMNRKAVNRAAAFLRCMGNDDLQASLVGMLSPYVHGWDNPKETTDTKGVLRLAGECSDQLHSIQGQTNAEIADMMKKKD